MLSFKEYIDSNDVDEKIDYEEHIFDKVFAGFTENLPRMPLDGTLMWTDGVEILCRTEELADSIANALETISGECEAHTGYYDPAEDARDGAIDDHTGWYYIDYD